MALLDMAGVASIMPFIAVFSTPEIIHRNPFFVALNDTLAFSGPDDFLFFLGVTALVIFVFSVMFKALTTYLILRYTHMCNHSLGKRLLSVYFRQPYESFLRRHSAEFSKMVLGEVQQVTSGIIMPLLNLFAHGAVIVALLTLLLLIDPVVALAAGLVLPLAYLLAYLVVRKPLANLGIKRAANNQVRFETVNEAFGGIKELKVSGREEIFQNRFDDSSKSYATTLSTAQTIVQLPRYALEIVAFGGMLLFILTVMGTSSNLQESLPALAVYGVAGYRLLPSLQAVYGVLSTMRFSRPALDNLVKDFRDLGEARSDQETQNSIKFKKAFSFKNVSYSYPGSDHNALESISLEVGARSTVGFAGPTGSGKTTIIDLLLGLFFPIEGTVKIDGQPLTENNARSWQNSIGYVPQHIYLIHDTVAANIAFGVPEQEIDYREVERAAALAQIHDFVTQELSDGYKTNVGERGVRLSGGQRQRIGIARALYRNPKLLILDEATSALDSLTENLVMQALCNSSNDLTLVMIAHRLSTLRQCDKIYVISDKKIQAEGTYEELVDKDPMFRQLASIGDSSMKELS